MCISRVHFAVVGLALSLSGCGVFSPKFQDYEEATSSPADIKTDCGAAAAALFASDVQPGIQSTCASSSCHSGPARAKLPLSADDAETNRAVIFRYTGLQRETLSNFIGSAQHPGGNQSSVLPVDKVGPWIDKETECAAKA